MNEIDLILMTRIKADELKEDFSGQPCGKKNKVEIEELNLNLARFSKRISLGDCVIDTDKTAVVQGGIIAVVADFAGVYLARLHSESDSITPLTNLDEQYFQPFVLGSDEMIVARAFIKKITDNRICVNVLIENEKGQSKGQAVLAFAKKFHK